MGRIIRFVPDRHEEAQKLLPWYLNGELDDDERARVEAHLRECAECQGELRLERRLADAVADLPFEADNGWAAMRQRIDEQPEPRRPFSSLGRALAAPGRAGWAVAAQFAAVVAALALVLPLARPAQYQTLGAAKRAAPGDVIVIFRPEAKAEDLTRALRASGARLVDGPTAADAYVLDVPAARRAQALSQLRADEAVSLAEPIDPAHP